MKKAIKIILMVCGGLFILFFLLMYIGAQSEKSANAVATTEAAPAPIPVEKPEDLPVITANTLVNAYKDNEVAADQQYKDTRMIVTGTIDNIGKDILDNPYVVLKTSDGYRQVQCSFEGDNQVATLHKNAAIKIKGTCSGLMMNVQLKDCSIVE